MRKEMAQPADEDLVALILSGQQGRFSQLVERYQGRLVNFLYRMLRDLDEAHDLAQEVFLRVYNALDRFDPKYRFSTWLFRVAQNLAIDEIRKRRIQVVSLQRPEGEAGEAYEWDPPSDSPGPYRNLRNRERGEAIQEVIAALPWEYRELVLLRHYAELSYDEIATLKEMPLGTVKNKLFRGRQMLKEKLAEFLED
jgi:RNA polymerase sigma-70 factor, ECF subfamily